VEFAHISNLVVKRSPSKSGQNPKFIASSMIVCDIASIEGGQMSKTCILRKVGYEQHQRIYPHLHILMYE
jgi:hypothetical protein